MEGEKSVGTIQSEKCITEISVGEHSKESERDILG